MWNNWPMNDVVFWPKTEKIIGVLGVNPRATSIFFQQLSDKPVHKEWQHPRVLIDSNPKIPSRGRHIELHEPSPVPYMIRSIAGLIEQGAGVIAVPCNTAHIFYDEYTKPFSVAIPNICEVTADAAANAQCTNMLVLGSRSTIKSGLYQKALTKRSITATLLDAQDIVSDIIEMVKQNRYDRQLVHTLKAEISTCTAIDSILLGCTEFTVIADIFSPYTTIDSSLELAKHCLDIC